MGDFTRGQETFVNRLIMTFANLIRLSLFSSLIALVAFTLLVYFFAPSELWVYQSVVFEKTLKGLSLMNASPSKFRQFFDYTWKGLVFYKDFFLSMGIWSGMVGGSTWLIAFAMFSVQGRKLIEDEFIRGTKLISVKEFNRECIDFFREERREIIRDAPIYQRPFLMWQLRVSKFKGRPFKVNSDGLAVYEHFQFRHIGATGASGTGKTMLIDNYLVYCREAGQKAFILDPNGEFASKFYQEGDIILSLYDKRTHYYTLKDERKFSSEELASYQIPEGSASHAFFWKSGRQVLSDLYDYDRDEGNLWKKVNDPSMESILGSLSGLSQKIAAQGKGGQGSGVIGTTILDLKWLRDLNYWPKKLNKQGGERVKGLSLYDWAQNDDLRWVFVTFSDSDHESMKPLISLWTNIAIVGLLGRPLNRVKNLPTINFVCEEMSTIGKIEKIPIGLDRARKYGGKFLIGYQTGLQLDAIFGEKAARAIKAALGTRFIFRTNDKNENKDLSSYLGSQEVMLKKASRSYGTRSYSDRESLSEDTVTRPVVMDTEIAQLKDGYFYLRCLHINPVKSRILKRKVKAVCETYDYYHGYPDRNECGSDKVLALTSEGLEIVDKEAAVGQEAEDSYLVRRRNDAETNFEILNDGADFQEAEFAVDDEI